jgi:ribosome biogenesis GTPase YqeH
LQLPSYCRGCGIPLQVEKPDQPGYIPPEALTRKSKLCQRCYRILHYGKNEEAIVEREFYIQAIKRALKEAELVVQVFDIIDFEGSFSEELHELIGTKPLVTAVTKIDLLPQQVTIKETEDWVWYRFKDLGLMPKAVIPVSSAKGWGIKKLLETIQLLAGKKRLAAVAGVTNVGKSSLLNALRRRAGDGVKNKRRSQSNSPALTTSSYPGTTRGIVRVDLPTAGVTLLDTPGIVPRSRISDLLCPDCNQKLIPAGELSRKTFKLIAGQSLLFGGIVEFAIKGGVQRPILMSFAARGVVFHSTTTQRVPELIARHAGDWLVPPCKKCDIGRWKKIKVEVNEGEDLVIPGLGWISIRRGPVEMEIKLPEGVKTIVRKALVAPEK